MRARSRHARIRDKTLGSFEDWADLVADAVHWLTGTNPIDVIEKRKDGDVAALAERCVIGELAEKFPGGEKFTAAKAAARLEPEVWGAVVNLKDGKPTGRAIAYWFLSRKDRRFSVKDAHGNPQVVMLQNDGVDRRNNTLWCIHASAAPHLQNGAPTPPSKQVGANLRQDLVDRGSIPGAETQGSVRDTGAGSGDAGDISSARGKSGSLDTDNSTVDSLREVVAIMPGIPASPEAKSDRERGEL